MYFYRSIDDLLPEELERAKKVTKELERMLKTLDSNYENAYKGYDRCSDVLDKRKIDVSE